MPVITIRGQFGTWSNDIGKLIAQKLNLDYVDRGIIDAVARRLRVPGAGIGEGETPPSTLWGRIAEAIGKTSYLSLGDGGEPGITSTSRGIPLDDTRYLSGLEGVIKELAGSQSIVILGRGSQFILKDFPGAFHVLIVAPFDVRVKNVVERLKLNERDARNEITRYDDDSRAFIKRYFQADIVDPINYDIVINTNHLTTEDAASIIVESWLGKTGQAHRW